MVRYYDPVEQRLINVFPDDLAIKYLRLVQKGISGINPKQNPIA